jgi:hypothetical protein
MGPARGNVDQGSGKVADNTDEQNIWIKPNEYNKKNLYNSNNNNRNQRTTNQNTDESAVGRAQHNKFQGPKATENIHRKESSGHYRRENQSESLLGESGWTPRRRKEWGRYEQIGKQQEGGANGVADMMQGCRRYSSVFV